MTPSELLQAVDKAEANGHEFVMLTVMRKREPKSYDSARLWKGGPRCRFIGWIEGERYLVEVKADALRAAVGKLVSP